MRILTDQDVYETTSRFLRAQGHDLLLASNAGLARASDSDLLTFAVETERVFITRDRDFGRLVFAQGLGAGVVYLRMVPGTANAVHQELNNVFTSYTERQLRQAFIVVEPGRYRFRNLALESEGGGS